MTQRPQLLGSYGSDGLIHGLHACCTQGNRGCEITKELFSAPAMEVTPASHRLMSICHSCMEAGKYRLPDGCLGKKGEIGIGGH